jgi:3-dehydroquinate dehydratase / shikimate dehydrogenase
MPDPRRMLAIALGRPTMAEALDALSAVRNEADCVELRLDHFEEPFDVSRLLGERGNLPVVVTLRPTNQGGNSLLAAPERLTVLLQAARLGAEFVDLEFDAASPAAVCALQQAGARVIVSRHDFAGMSSDLSTTWLEDLAQRRADVVKLVGTAHDALDCLPVFRAFRVTREPMIAIAMGEAGLATRVLALREDNCLLTYAAPASGAGTAPGQLTVRDLRETYAAERLRPTSRVYGLLGPHVESDRAAHYNAWFTRDSVDAVAVPFTTLADSAAEIVTAYRELPIAGWHIHGADLQASVGQALDHLAPTACHQGKVNAVTVTADAALHGHWVESPREQFDLWLHSAA